MKYDVDSKYEKLVMQRNLREIQPETKGDDPLCQNSRQKRHHN